MGKMFGQNLDTRLIKWKLGLLWKNEVNNTFYLDHFGRKWFALEFMDKDDLKFVMKNQPWYVHGQIFHLERWTTNFKDMDDVAVNDDVKASLQKDVMLCFPNPTIVEEECTKVEESGQHVDDVGPDEEGWTTVVPRERKMSYNSRDDKSYREVVASPKPKWVTKADIVQDWRRARKSK
ncbi:hypothetical protein D8674_017711 [Pyrus ussuriensis x Pyrus communis]|uniref:DUF4283 domain-containing protein n=1 Tax=Pyrus ussuriensis x Pyrus communis TaxID=2448454 RepID=A0A5N5HIN0_9ROSA|nr:hypothetical protein D8674_017711 [Pyrus ussuriensis x Pyrus communis]